MHKTGFRAAPVLALVVLAPFCAEYLLGGISLRELINLPFLMPLYGAAALLIHEIVRRAGRGYPTVVGLGAAFGTFQAGLVDASMFNPDYGGFDLAGPVVPGIDWNIYWGMAFVVNHAVFSIAVPIALTEALFDRGGEHRPWMGMRGHWSTVAWLGGGFVLLGTDAREVEDYWPTLPQQAFVLVLAAAFVAAAFWGSEESLRSADNRLWRKCSEPTRERPDAEGQRVSARTRPPAQVPSVSVTWLASSIVLLLFSLLPATWAGVLIGLALIVAAFAAVVRWSARPGWGERHRLALVAGAITVGAPFAFVVGDFMGATDAVSMVGYGLFGAVAFLLVGLSFRVQARRRV